MNETQSQCEFQNGSINELTGMSMSQSFFMRIDFIMNIACLLKLSIHYWNSFDLASITVNVVKSNASSGLYSSNQHIYPELILAIGLRWLADGNLIDITHVYGVSYPSVYAITKTFLDAVNSCTTLSIKFPTKNKEKQTVMNGFLEKSESNYFVDALVVL